MLPGKPHIEHFGTEMYTFVKEYVFISEVHSPHVVMFCVCSGPGQSAVPLSALLQVMPRGDFSEEKRMSSVFLWLCLCLPDPSICSAWQVPATLHRPVSLCCPLPLPELTPMNGCGSSSHGPAFCLLLGFLSPSLLLAPLSPKTCALGKTASLQKVF